MSATPEEGLPEAETAQRERDGVLHNRDFVKLWVGETVSLIGSQVTQLVLPIVAIVTLSASVFEVGVLNAARYAPIAVVSLFAGVWLDRRRRRPVLIATNLGRAMLAAAIPLAFALGVLSMELLYVVVALLGALSVVFDVGVLSYLPGLVDRRHLSEANGKVQISFSLSTAAGPGLGGLLVGLFSAPYVLLLDAIGFLFSASMMRWIAKPEQPPPAPAEHTSVWRAIGEGWQAVFSSRLLRSLLNQSAAFNLFWNAELTVLVVYAIRGLGLTPSQLGFVIAAGAAGAIVGAYFATRVTAALGLGRTMVLSVLCNCLSPLLVLVPSGASLASLGILTLAQLTLGVGLVLYNVNTVTLRQVVTPNRLLARMNASYRLVLFGTVPLGALLGGALGEAYGLHTAMVVTVLLMITPLAWLVSGPVFRLREMPPAAVDEAPEAAPVPAS
jgi:predicted MFS family arabinose efflux permease